MENNSIIIGHGAESKNTLDFLKNKLGNEFSFLEIGNYGKSYTTDFDSLDSTSIEKKELSSNEFILLSELL